MPQISVFISERTLAALYAYGRRTGREIADLAECAISNGALEAERLLHPIIDPARCTCGGRQIGAGHFHLASCGAIDPGGSYCEIERRHDGAA